MGLIVLIRFSQNILKVVNGTFHHRDNNSNDNDDEGDDGDDDDGGSS